MSAESDAAKTLASSQNPAELAHAAQVLAASAAPEDQRLLLDNLKSPAFQDRLDPPAKGESTPENMWMARPLRSLQNNPAPAARATLIELMKDAPFNSNLSRTDLLIGASASIRPPTPPVIDFWRKQADPRALHLGRLITALLDNGDTAAVAQFEQILINTAPGRPDEGGDARIRWLHGPFLQHRDNPALLLMAQRLLAKTQPPHWTPDIQTTLAESIFLCDPQWYRPHQEFHAPPLIKTPPAGRQTLRQIADQIRKTLNPSPLLDAGITATLTQLDALSNK